MTLDLPQSKKRKWKGGRAVETTNREKEKQEDVAEEGVDGGGGGSQAIFRAGAHKQRDSGAARSGGRYAMQVIAALFMGGGEGRISGITSSGSRPAASPVVSAAA